MLIDNINDTIVSIATPIGKGGVGIVRVSGNKSYFIGSNILNKSNLEDKKLEYSGFFDKNNNLIDVGLYVYFKSPKSFTGEDVLEFHAHGNQIILNKIVFRVIELGGRLAEPGEFTFRAFINNKIDLLQAESINSIVNTGSLQIIKMNLKSLDGSFSNKINFIINLLIDIRKDIEASIDFPDFINFEYNDFIYKFNVFEKAFFILFNNIYRNNSLYDVPKIVIVGKTNVGKSTLFNLLLGNNRSIVSDIPGTTRDFIVDSFYINGVTFDLVDTAGFNDYIVDSIEKEGVSRTNDQLKLASIVIYVTDSLDLNIENDFFFRKLLSILNNKEIIIVRNKIDLFNYNEKMVINNNFTEIFMSSKTELGFDLLLNLIKDKMMQLGNDYYLVNNRHFNLIIKSRDLLMKIKNDLNCNYHLDTLSEDLKFIHLFLSNILGRDVSNDVIDAIFSSFCLGK